jgi:hypothetical protein
MIKIQSDSEDECEVDLRDSGKVEVIAEVKDESKGHLLQLMKKVQ